MHVSNILLIGFVTHFWLIVATILLSLKIILLFITFIIIFFRIKKYKIVTIMKDTRIVEPLYTIVVWLSGTTPLKIG